MKSPRNKTVNFPLSEADKYLHRCTTAQEIKSSSLDLASLLDSTIIARTEEVLPLLPTGFVDVAIVDPPYNLAKDFHGTKFAQQSVADYREFTQSWVSALVPLLKPHASVYVCSDWKTSLVIYEVLAQYFMIHNRITWQREKGRGAKNNWKNSMEDIWFATVSDTYTFHVDAVKMRKKVVAPYKIDGKPKDWVQTSEGNYRDTHPSNFWDDITIPYWSMPENTAHPTQKPEKLIAKLILASSNVGDVVFDPFLGSGTTSVTAKKLRRHYLGIEHNPLYCAWAEKRLELADIDPSIQGYTDGVFWDRNTLAEQKHQKRTEP